MDNRHPNGTGPGNADEVAARSKDTAARTNSPTAGHPTVHDIRRAKVSSPGLDTLEAPANRFQVSVGHLLGETNTVHPARPNEPTEPAEPTAQRPQILWGTPAGFSVEDLTTRLDRPLVAAAGIVMPVADSLTRVAQADGHSPLAAAFLSNTRVADHAVNA
ncbi:hypothetical protein [Streptomyces sp. NPDC057939]|uniref:hypothetical protein n=1 Tax=Streptomyces sp. NPDC057939 TaxID=3346284 RepID=UPI0036ECB392